MVTAKKVLWAESAKKDLQNIYNRIALKSPERAKEVLMAILQKASTLNTEYHKGAPVALLLKEPDPYKVVMSGFYKIIYSIVAETVVVETLYHERQEPVVG
jgi:plasmid stabilization system protein ParE